MAIMTLVGATPINNATVSQGSSHLSYSSFVSSSDDTYIFLNSNGDRVVVKGFDITTSAGRFSSGTITEIKVFDGSSGSDPVLFKIEDINLSGTEILGSNGAGVPSFAQIWQTLFEGVTFLSSQKGLGFLGGLDGLSVNSGYVDGQRSVVDGKFEGFSWVSGGFNTIGGTAIYNGGRMEFTGSAYTVAGDVYYTYGSSVTHGGNDKIVFVNFNASQVGNSATIFVSGDVVGFQDSSLLSGGDDVIDIRQVSNYSGQIRVTGDVYNGNSSGHMFGGDDIIRGSLTLDNVISGDSYSYNGGMTGGDDTIWGGAGDDLLYGDILSNGATSANGGNDTIFGGAGDDTIGGNGGRDEIHVGSGSALAYGHNGADTFIVEKNGPHTFYGGNGNDRIDYSKSKADKGINVDLQASTITKGWGTGDTIFSIEHVTGTDKGDTVYGTDGLNRIKGGDGNDLIHGRGGGDVIKAGNGQDSIVAYADSNTYDGGAGLDFLTYFGSNARVVIDLQNKTASGGYADNDTLISIEHLSGSAFNDVLKGNGAANILRGNAGSDNLTGRSGNDVLKGGNGADVLLGGNGVDDLQGGDGSDFMAGGNANDFYTGGAGADTFHFDKGGKVDVIADFQNNIDTIELDGFGGAFNPFGNATMQNGDAILYLGNDDYLIVENTTLQQLQNDVVLV